MKKTVFSIVVSFVILTGSTSFAQIYVVFDGVKGESNFKAFPSSTELSSLNWVVKNSTTIIGGGGGATVGKALPEELVITKPRGSVSSALQMLVFNGRNIPKAEIRFYKLGAAAPVPYLTITLENIFITNWSLSADGRGTPMESFSLLFSKFRTEDAILKPDGTMEKLPPVGWDIAKNMSY